MLLPGCAHEIIRRVILLNRPILRHTGYERFWVACSPLRGRATLTVEVTRPRGRTQAVLPWEFFRIPSGLKCGERREAGRGAGVHARQAEVTFRTYSLPHGRYAQTAFKEVLEANRRGTWTLNTQTGHVKTAENQMSGYATTRELTATPLKKCDVPRPRQTYSGTPS